MSLVLDSTVLIASERRRETVKQLEQRIQSAFGDVESVIWTVSVVELTHGIYRARTPEDRERRTAFIQGICEDLLIQPLTLEIAQLAGRIEGEQAPKESQSRLKT